MLRLLVVVPFLLAGCADPAPAAESDATSSNGEIQSNETTEVAAPELDAQADTTGPAVVTVAGQSVPARAVVTNIESSPQSCTLTLRTDGGGTEAVSADYSVCDSDVILNRRVQINYEENTVLAASCEGDPDCLDTETVALAVVAEPID